MKNNLLQYKVEGMTCDHCKATVENGLRNLKGVTGVLADRGQNQVSIQADSLSDDQVRETIEKLGYRFGGRM